MSSCRQKKGGKTESRHQKNKKLVVSRRWDWYKVKCPNWFKTQVNILLRSMNFYCFMNNLSIRQTEDRIQYKILSDNIYIDRYVGDIDDRYEIRFFTCINMTSLTYSRTKYIFAPYHRVLDRVVGILEKNEAHNKLDNFCSAYISTIRKQLMIPVCVPSNGSFDYTKARWYKSLPLNATYTFLMYAKRLRIPKDVAKIIARDILATKNSFIWHHKLPSHTI